MLNRGREAGRSGEMALTSVRVTRAGHTRMQLEEQSTDEAGWLLGLRRARLALLSTSKEEANEMRSKRMERDMIAVLWR